jgi:hypothetical protein
VFAGLSDPALRTLAGCVVIFVGILVTMALLNMVVRSMVKALGLSEIDFPPPPPRPPEPDEDWDDATISR